MKRRLSISTYSRLRSVEMIDAYVDGRPMPDYSIAVTRVAAEYGGGGSVQCCALRTSFERRRARAATAGRMRSRSSVPDSSSPFWYTAMKPGLTPTEPVGRNEM